MIEVVIFDYDGTLHDAFSGANRFSVWCRCFSSRHLRMLYPLLELVERVMGFYRPLFSAGIGCLEFARKRGLLVGIVTDRGLCSLVRSAGKGGLDVYSLDFVRVRKRLSYGNAIVSAQVPLIWRSAQWKDDLGGLSEVVRHLDSFGIAVSSVLLVGDDERDCRAAHLAGFRFVGVDRHKPDFMPVYQAIAGKNFTGA